MKSNVVVIGAVYGKWIVIADAGVNKHHHRVVRVRCQCGTIADRELSTLIHGRSPMCWSCAGIEHGHCKNRKASSEYWIWHGMKKRCHNPKTALYSYYGGRGITVCDRWRKSFEAFLADVGLRPAKHLTLERINNDGNYEPGNVKWATRFEQQSNRRSSRFRTLEDDRISLSAIARYLAMPRNILYRNFRQLGLCS